MQMNIMQLIKEGKNGDHLRSRGGNRYTYNKYAFVKIRKDTVQVYTAHSWNTLKKTESLDVHQSVATLTKDKVIFNLPKQDPERNWRKSEYNVWPMAGFLSLNLLYDCYKRWSYSEHLIHTPNKGDVIPFARMEFDWQGNLISKIPLKAKTKYEAWDRQRKDNINRQSRARYAQAKAEREFRKYEKAGKLEEYPIENVFTIRNAQLRSHALNAIGLEKVLAPYPMKVINKDIIDGRPYELVDIELPSISVYQWGRTTQSSPKWCLYLKMTNPSTGEYHLEGVPRKSDSSWDYIPEETVKGALAWRDGEAPERNRPFGSKGENTSEWKYIQPATIT